VTILVYLVTVRTRTGQLLGELMLGGRPPDAAPVNFTVVVTDALGATDDKDFTLTIN